jgi:hypothetical protein
MNRPKLPHTAAPTCGPHLCCMPELLRTKTMTTTSCYAATGTCASQVQHSSTRTCSIISAARRKAPSTRLTLAHEMQYNIDAAQ